MLIYGGTGELAGVYASGDIGIGWIPGDGHSEHGRTQVSDAIGMLQSEVSATHAMARFIAEGSQEHITWCNEIRSIPFKRLMTCLSKPARSSPPRHGIHRMLATCVQGAACHPSLLSQSVKRHSIRHTTAPHLLRSRVDINTVRAWLGGNLNEPVNKRGIR